MLAGTRPKLAQPAGIRLSRRSRIFLSGIKSRFHAADTLQPVDSETSPLLGAARSIDRAIRSRRPSWPRPAFARRAARTGPAYRQVAADLSVLRKDSTARVYAQRVNELLARAHHIIYSGRKTNAITVFRFL